MEQKPKCVLILSGDHIYRMDYAEMIAAHPHLQLGGKMLAFNIDPLISNVVDGLILVDLMKTDIRILERFMGKNGAAVFGQYHRLPMYMSAA
jgi:ADP-glucose pyrophosphorylase